MSLHSRRAPPLRARRLFRSATLIAAAAACDPAIALAADIPPGASSQSEDTPERQDTPVPDVSMPRRARARADSGLEGGISLAATSELWSPSMLGTGLGFDVGVGLGRGFSFVVGEDARFAFSRHGLKMAVFDLQAGVAFGAPYQTRTGWGIVLLGSAERLSTSATMGGLVTWSAAGSLGLRASLAIASVDVFAGLDAVARSNTVETGGPDPFRVARLTGLLSIGCFFPAFGVTGSSLPLRQASVR